LIGASPQKNAHERRPEKGRTTKVSATFGRVIFYRTVGDSAGQPTFGTDAGINKPTGRMDGVWGLSVQKSNGAVRRGQVQPYPFAQT